MGSWCLGISILDVAVVFAYDYFSPMGPMLISCSESSYTVLRHLGNVGILYCLAAEGTGQAALACSKAVRPLGLDGAARLGLSLLTWRSGCDGRRTLCSRAGC